jgi:cAMP-dependent protein kinase regulator
MRKAEATRIREALDSSPLFRGLPVRRLQRLLAASRLESYDAGAVIVHEGTLGDAFYVVIEGEVAVQVSHGTGDVTRLATLGPGDYFGEMALLSGRPRVADVLATRATEVLAVPAAVFDANLAGDVRFKARLSTTSQERETDLQRQRVARTLQSVPVFASLRWEELQRIAASAQIRTVEKGTVICRQGDPASALYVVLSGELEVRNDTPGGERTLTALGPGSSFGETALLTEAPLPSRRRSRPPSCRSTRPTSTCSSTTPRSPAASPRCSASACASST